MGLPLNGVEPMQWDSQPVSALSPYAASYRGQPPSASVVLMVNFMNLTSNSMESFSISLVDT